MPSTTYTDFDHGLREIQGRTDSAGTDIIDMPLVEDRMIHAILTEGFLTADAFVVEADSPASMDVIVGSGTANADVYVVEGDDAGQWPYTVQLQATTVTVTLDAADASDARTDEIWLVVQDKNHDASGNGLARVAYRKGDAGGGAPGADSSWKAAVLLASVAVGAGVTEVTDSDITDERAAAALIDTLQDSFTGSLVVKNSAEAASFDTGGAGAWEDALTVDLTVPSWSGWDIDVLTTFEHIGADNLDWRIVIDGVTQNQISNVAQGLYSLGARDTGSSTGTVTVKFQVRDAGSGSNRLIDLYLFARADRTG